MKDVMKVGFGFILGAVVAAIIFWVSIPGMMLKEYASPYDVNKTVETIKANATAKGWIVPGVTPLHKSLRKQGFESRPTFLVNLCNGKHASKMLEKDENKVISTMMPCTISVYEKSDGKTYIGTMNAGLLGKAFGGDIAQVFGVEVANDQSHFIAFAK